MQRIKAKRKTQDPCSGCFLHRNLCLCESIPSLKFKTKLSLIIHYKELKRTTNTGVLATRALINSEVIVRGEIGKPLDLGQHLDPNYQAYLLYPCEESVELTREFVKASPRPIQLIVPDGNWRQASKVHYRHSELKHLPRVMIKTPNLETQFLRKETTPEGMATLQAIAHAFGVLEGAEAQAELLKLYKLKLERTFQGRSPLARALV